MTKLYLVLLPHVKNIKRDIVYEIRRFIQLLSSIITIFDNYGLGRWNTFTD